MSRRRPAFTLIELLVVIGIILILLAILIPAVGKIRQIQQNASSTATMQRIANCITSYFGDFNAFPGALPNPQFTSSRSTTLKFATTPANFTATTYTQTEDCVLALTGGLQFTAASNTLTFVPGDLGLGPQNFSPSAAATSGRYRAYMEYRVQDFTPIGPSGPQPLSSMPDMLMTYCKDSCVPEFMDNFGSPRPIVYMRANVGAPAVNTAAVYNGKSGFNAAFHYDFGAFAPYSNMNPGSTAPPVGKQDFGGQDPGATPQPSVGNFFTASNLNGARNAGTYILLCSGVDRVFGSPDDIIIGPGGAQ